MMRLNKRSNRSRALILLISGARSPEFAPAFAISGAAGDGAELETLYTIPPTRRRHNAPAIVQVRRSEGAEVDLPADRPQRWQKRAWGDSSAWHAWQDCAVSRVPHALQKLPIPEVPQLGQVVEGVVIPEKRKR
jgi:hypothetical protein